MALAASDSLSTFDQVTNKRLDLSPVLSTILLNDTAALGVFGMGSAAMRSEHRWGEDSLNPPSLTVNNGGPIAAVDTTFVVTDASKIAIGALLMNEADGLTEVMQVTDVTVATNTLTVTRNYDGGGAVVHPDASTLAIIGQPKQEGDESITDISRDRAQDFNYTQIFKRTVKVSGTQEAETNNGIHPGVASEARLQLERRTMELQVELNRAALNGIRSSTAGSDTAYRTMGGLRQFLTQAGGNNLDAAASAISEPAVNAMYERAWDDGGTPTTLIGNSKQINAFSGFNTNRFRVAPSDRSVGVFVEKYLTEFGAEISLVLDRWARNDELYMIDPSRVELAPLQGRALFTEPLAKVGDAIRWQMVAELTLVVRNANEAHASLTNLG